MKTLLILFGGSSSEHEVSRNSARCILNNLDASHYHILTLGITKPGEWMLTRATPDQIADGSWESRGDNRRAVLSPARTDHGLLVEGDGGIERVRVDCVWPVLHGRYGEDGTIQGLFEMSGIPYVGPNVFSSAVCMDKAKAKVLVAGTGIRQADYYLLHRTDYRAGAQKELDAIGDYFAGRLPLFVKPCIAGSSVGVTKVTDLAALPAAIETALRHDKKVLIEQAIVGREVEIAVLGNEHPEASVVGEILSANEFYDYSAKYINSASRTVVPADISDESSDALRRAAVTVYRTLDCEGLTRCDFFLTEDGTPVFNEANTMPGFTNISMYPKLWEASGLVYARLLDRLVELAVEAHPEGPLILE